MTDEHDPGARPEEEGIPDLQNGSPEAERASDPQRMPVPGDEPVAADKFGTTFSEQVEGAPLDERLAEEEPEGEEEEEPAGRSAAESEEREVSEPVPEEPPTEEAEGPLTEEAGQLSDEPLPERPANQDIFSQESPAQGLPAEETAVHIADDEFPELDLTGVEEEDEEAEMEEPP
ncbi:hypothetical protein [Streptomyces gobiensis]|uniref:hypothetical protein n=1 Tax=Streptomyces gobiensis TaxID=2875706 RepID=UPI001E58C827|nr:hypothetical protein [Streptomyces gobiensis]UGY94559.1 hypothetical protein test1122_24395 [Streptomyces gobiensis]